MKKIQPLLQPNRKYRFDFDKFLMSENHKKLEQSNCNLSWNFSFINPNFYIVYMGDVIGVTTLRNLYISVLRNQFPPKMRIVQSLINPQEIFVAVFSLTNKIPSSICESVLCQHLGCRFACSAVTATLALGLDILTTCYSIFIII